MFGCIKEELMKLCGVSGIFFFLLTDDTYTIHIL